LKWLKSNPQYARWRSLSQYLPPSWPETFLPEVETLLRELETFLPEVETLLREPEIFLRKVETLLREVGSFPIPLRVVAYSVFPKTSAA
jgi:hypothetical protein